VQPENLVAVPATSDGFWEHMRANPNLDVGEPAPVRMAGYDGQQATVIANIADGCFEEATFLWYSPIAGAWELSGGHEARFTALDAEDGVYLIAVETTEPGALDASFLGAADAVAGDVGHRALNA